MYQRTKGLLRALCARHLWLCNQLLKQSAVVNHRLAQIFGAGLPLRLKKCAPVRRTVIFENERMVHRDIRRSLFEVAYRITARGHHVAQQPVGIRYGSTGAVNESRLYSGPRVDKPRAIGLSYLSDVQALHSVGSLVEYCFCLPLAPAFFHGAGILSTTKLTAQSFCSASTIEDPSEDADDCYNRHSNDNRDLCRGYIC
jgi:hypothetical protein